MKAINTLLISSALTLTSFSGYSADTFCRADIKKDYTPVHFVSLKNGTIKDTRTGLIWSVCSLGQTWGQDAKGNDTCTGSPASYNTWKIALNAVQSANTTATFSKNDWRLPNIKELDSIVDRSCYRPAINQDVFPNTSPINYYSSTPYEGKKDTVSEKNYDHLTSRIIDFRNGLENPLRPEEQTREMYSVRLVRCGEWSTPDAANGGVTAACRIN